MKRTTALYCLATAFAVSLAACSGSSPESPTSPSSVTGSDGAANPDGSTLKVTAPTPLSPTNGAKVDTRRPTLTIANAAGKYSAASLSYRIELLDAAGNFIGAVSIPSGDGTTSYVVETDLAYATDFQWHARAELDGSPGPYSSLATFRSPDAPASPTATTPAPAAPSDGSVGPQRSIGLNEAFGIIMNIHNTLRWNLGGGSSRESRVDFINAAVAAIHYGHPRFNPAGADSGWCVKDAGGGRPQSDDVIVQCGSRDAWDLIGGAGGNGYSFHLDYLGRLPGGQNVYPPPRSALNFLGR